jgi:oxygen-independent coproporphyrinogen-3 oxidase
VPDVGVYIHVPFCERVCPYCDFAVVAARRLPRADEEAYVGAVLTELDRRRADFGSRDLASVYLGGGTPSLLHPDSVERLLRAVRDAFPAAATSTDAKADVEVEITLEVNPSSVERERLPGFRAAGVNRVSVGAQSFDRDTLRRLGRAHAPAEVHATLAACRAAGFPRISLDLIFAAPGQTAASLHRDLDAAVAFAPEHVSAYELTLEPGTPFAAAAVRGRIALPSEEDCIAMIEAVEERLTSAGLARYEISSYARPGHEAVHNRRYWERRPVLGLGVGAVSSDPPSAVHPHGVRCSNPRELSRYLAAVGQGAPPQREPVSAETARGEAVFLALRTLRGLDAARFAAEFGAPPRHFYGHRIDALARAELLVETPEGDLRLTARGRLLSDSIFAEFV